MKKCFLEMEFKQNHLGSGLNVSLEKKFKHNAKFFSFYFVKSSIRILFSLQMHLKICSIKDSSKNGFQHKLSYGPVTAMLFVSA